ncbi:MAG: hypothetical protein IKH29_03855 [Methanobrevibacter sp.]|uniref:helicase C-terminal domain-containing protein n=1 Tax=Methanobrevibacter sp. TaxID=66852 RepID=UPI0025F8ECC7|nr:helicase C-terminal domain-containing protein [Methanobrevibacter sp.]MBR3112831.1 hypothetical protein [Methanobrevibacter sp.]MBR4634418.1 hypothetical protein [bacterium]
MDIEYFNSQTAVLEQVAFEHDEEDLFEIIVQNKDLFEEFEKFSSEELYEKKNEYINNMDKMLKILSKTIEIDTLINEITKFDKYQVNPIVKKHFPYKNPRKYQLETISKIYDAIEKGYKYILLEAVSGFGKSGIAITLSDIYRDGQSYILNTTKQLSSQYQEEFEKQSFGRIFPRSDFECIQKEDKTCSPSYCKGFKCEFNQSNDCYFLENVSEGLKSDITFTSYPFFILENYFQSELINNKNLLPKRKLLILDEGHNIDDQIAQNVELTLYSGKMRDVGLNLESEARYLEESEEYYTFFKKAKIMYENKVNNYLKGSIKHKKYYTDLIKINKFLEYFKDDPQNIAFKTDGRTRLNFKPVKIDKVIKDIMLKYGDVCIFMSSSIFNSENFNYDIGIDEKETYVLKVPNIFELSNNPITIYNDFNMNYETLEEVSKKTLRTVKKILKDHRNEKGVIHTVSDECKDFLVENIDNPRLITHNTDNREEILAKFKKSKRPLVLVSPSMNEGVDLPGDQCRFQIIYKLPYAPPNPRVDRRKAIYDDGKEWYLYKMLTKLIQTYGRGIRYEGDYCKTYIIDNRIWDVIENDLEGKRIIPQYFLKSIEVKNED